MSQRKPQVTGPKAKLPDKSAEKEKAPPSQPIQRKLSHKEQQELAALPAGIEKLETKQDELYTLMADPEFFKKDPAEIAFLKDKLEKVEDELLRTFERWEFLEGSRFED